MLTKVDMKRNLLALAALVIAISPMTTNAASIVYDINRTIGAGTVTGFVQTDGTLGVLSAPNITDWSLTLAAPNLFGGSPSSISFASGSTSLFGLATTATLSQLLFDFSDAGSFFLLQSATNPFNFWCLETVNVSCTGSGPGEHMGQGSPFFVGQSATHSGPTVLGAVSVAPVPEPEIYAMMGVGLGLLGWVGRRRKLKEAASV